MASFPVSLNRPDLVEDRGLIGGEWIRPDDGESFPVYDPSNGKVIQNCPSFNTKDFQRAIDLAQVGFEEFSASTTAKERGALLRRWNDLVLQHEEDCKNICSGSVRTKTYSFQWPRFYRLRMEKLLPKPLGRLNMLPHSSPGSLRKPPAPTETKFPARIRTPWLSLSRSQSVSAVSLRPGTSLPL